MEYASNGKANAGLTLGIIGTSLAGLLSGMGNGSGLNFFGGNNNCQATVAALESQIAELKAMRYTDSVGQDLYKAIVEVAKEEDAKISSNLRDVMGYIVDLSKDVALNKQAADYEQRILNDKIDCCCDKMGITALYENRLRDLADANIVSYVNGNFVPGKLIMPIASICPEPAVATPTTTA